MTHSLFTACTVVLQVLLVSSVAWAQATSVTGRVVDPQGAVIANAEITLTAPGQPARSARTGQDGTFTFASVPPGSYTVRVDAAGFTSAMQSVAVGTSAATLTMTMEVAGVSEDVTVQGALIGTVSTGKTTVPVRDLPMTVESVPSQLIEEQGANDLVTALQNVPGVYSFTTYGVYEVLHVPRLLRLGAAPRRRPERGQPHQHAVDEHRSHRSAQGTLVRPLRRRGARRHRQPDSQEALRGADLRLFRPAPGAGKPAAWPSVPAGG